MTHALHNSSDRQRTPKESIKLARHAHVLPDSVRCHLAASYGIKKQRIKRQPAEPPQQAPPVTVTGSPWFNPDVRLAFRRQTGINWYLYHPFPKQRDTFRPICTLYACMQPQKDIGILQPKLVVSLWTDSRWTRNILLYWLGDETCIMYLFSQGNSNVTETDMANLITDLLWYLAFAIKGTSKSNCQLTRHAID